MSLLVLYLQELISLRKPNKYITLRKDTDKLLLEHKTPEKQDYKNRSFSFAASNFWNQLPLKIRESQTVQAFKTNLKTFYYNEWTQQTSASWI